ncbi:MAG: hypothetical protein Q8K98_05300 [Bacteroidota bacterium]|nr:hypothetical protein [Bacteroidota bacterium]
MNLKQEILREHSKRQVKKIASWVGGDKSRLKKLMELFLSDDYIISQRSAWCISQCADNNPELLNPWLKPMIRKMQEPGVHDAVKRNVLRILQKADIPTSLLGIVVSLCFDYLNSLKAPIAVKVYSMAILMNAAKREKGLRNELKLVLENMQPYVGPALQARSKAILRELMGGSNPP